MVEHGLQKPLFFVVRVLMVRGVKLGPSAVGLGPGDLFVAGFEQVII